MSYEARKATEALAQTVLDAIGTACSRRYSAVLGESNDDSCTIEISKIGTIEIYREHPVHGTCGVVSARTAPGDLKKAVHAAGLRTR